MTVVYPGMELYWKDFITSLEAQTCRDFDLIIINDGVTDFEFESQILNITTLNCSASISKVREFAINTIIEFGYQTIIFGDSDDFFKENRVEVSLNALKEYDIVVNELELFAGEKMIGNCFSQVLNNKQEISLDFIKNKNLFGLSNTAIRLNKIPNIILEDYLIAVDWYLFTYLLSKNKKAVFLAETSTFYRQHGQNTAGMRQEKDLSQIQKGILVKKYHCQAVLERNLFPEDSYWYKNWQFFSELYDNENKLKEYFKNLNQNEIRNSLFWWAEIYGVNK